MVVVTIAVALRAAPSAAVGSGIAAGALLLVVGVAVIAIASALRFAMVARVVTAEHVYAALSVYLLAGLFFGVLHWAVDSARPAAPPASPCPPRSTSAS